MAPRSIAPGYEQIVIRIEDVDIPNRLVHAFDKTNSRIQVSWRDISGGSALRIPRQGEAWTAVRQGFVWRLKDRLHTANQHDAVVGIATAGDTLIDTSGTVYLNGRPAGAWVNDIFTSALEYTGVTVRFNPVNPAGVQVFVNGLLVAPNLWTIDGNVITFDVLMSAGVIVVYYETLDTAVYYETGVS